VCISLCIGLDFDSLVPEVTVRAGMGSASEVEGTGVSSFTRMLLCIGLL